MATWEDGCEIWVPDVLLLKAEYWFDVSPLEHAYEYYKAYVKKVGFEEGTNPASKAGASTSNNWKVLSNRTHCKAVFCVKFIEGKLYWCYDFVEGHNHNLVCEEDVVFMKSSYEVTYTQQVFLYQVSHNFRRDVLEFISKDDAQMIVEMLMNKKDFLPNFSFQYETGENNALTNLFSIDEYAKRNYYVFGDNFDKPSEQYVQDLNHLNFFNFDYLDDHPDIPNDEERSDPNPTRYDTLSPHSGSTFEPLHENEEEHSQEMDALYRNNTWKLADLPKDEKYRERIDFNETFSYVVKRVTVRCLINLAVQSVVGEIENFLGIEVLETLSGICLNQRKYCLELIDKFGLLASKPFYIPMQPNISLSSEPKDDDPLLDNITEYEKLIGKLIYLTTTRPDNAYTICCLSQFMHSPLRSHLKTAIKVIRYLKGSPGKGINLIKRFASSIDLKAYTDADCSRCTNTEEAEYRALAYVNSEVIWVLKNSRRLKL
ncbi:ribonuclease H-like domain-containing protein [Tanacetum coccineum]